MASVEDRWYVTRTRPDGIREQVPTVRHGRGSRWLLRWRDPDGRPRSKAYARKAEADRAATRAGVDPEFGAPPPPDPARITFRTYAEEWRSTQFADPLTASGIEIRLRLHVYPALGSIPLPAITPSTIRRWTHGLAMSRSYQRSIFQTVAQILSAAVADDLITKNPCHSPTVRKPAPDVRDVVPWTAARVAAVRAALPPQYAIVATLAAGTGMRQGEIFGLSPDEIDFDAETIAVTRQVKLSHGNLRYLAPPKGRKSRTIPLPASVADELRSFLAAHPPRTVTLPWDRPDGQTVTVPLLLTTREHGALNRNYFNAHVWKPALIRAGVPPTRDNGCHALRHFYASVLLDGGESIKTVSQRLGHADPAFTLRTYTHLLPSNESRTRSIIDASMRAMHRPPRAPGVHHGLG